MSKKYFRTILFAILVGILAGISSAIFLLLLDIVTNIRSQNQWLIFGLPIAAYVLAWIYAHTTLVIRQGTQAVVVASQTPLVPKPVPLMTPVILFSTLWTHLFGGSAGREGTAIQMSGGLAGGLLQYWPSAGVAQNLAIKMAIAAGFSSVFGVPLAAIIFSLEVSKTTKIKITEILAITLASYLGYLVCNLFPIHHTQYTFALPRFEASTLAWVMLVSVAFGLTAKLYVELAEFGTKVFKTIKSPYRRIVLGGGVVLLAFVVLGKGEYHGIGIDAIQAAFVAPHHASGFLIKMVLTIITLSCGMKGGEVTPLFFIGATLGSTLSGIVPLPIGFLAGLGFLSVFSGAAKTPLACVVMGIEVFGLPAALLFVISCLGSHFISGKKGIYDAT